MAITKKDVVCPKCGNEFYTSFVYDADKINDVASGISLEAHVITDAIEKAVYSAVRDMEPEVPNGHLPCTLSDLYNVEVENVDVRFRVQFTIPDKWADNCDMNQVFRQARAEALQRLEKVLTKNANALPGLKMIGDPYVEIKLKSRK